MQRLSMGRHFGPALEDGKTDLLKRAQAEFTTRNFPAKKLFNAQINLGLQYLLR